MVHITHYLGGKENLSIDQTFIVIERCSVFVFTADGDLRIAVMVSRRLSIGDRAHPAEDL